MRNDEKDEKLFLHFQISMIKFLSICFNINGSVLMKAMRR